MKKFTVTRNMIPNDFFIAEYEAETEAEFLELVLENKKIGKRDRWAQASKDEDGNDILPEDLVDPQESRVRTIEVEAYTGVDDVGNEVEYEAYSYDVTEYKQVDQWSYTVEDISDIVTKKDRIKSFEDGLTSFNKDICEKIMLYVEKLNSDYNRTSLDKDAMMNDASLGAILTMLKVASRPRKAKALVQAYLDGGDESYFTNEDKQAIIDYINDRLDLNEQ